MAWNVNGAVVKAGTDTCDRPGGSGPLPDGGTAETCPGSGGSSASALPDVGMGGVGAALLLLLTGVAIGVVPGLAGWRAN